MGKGSNRRKGDNQKQYAENWEKIFGKDKKKKEKKKDAIEKHNNVFNNDLEINLEVSEDE